MHALRVRPGQGELGIGLLRDHPPFGHGPDGGDGPLDRGGRRQRFVMEPGHPSLDPGHVQGLFDQGGQAIAVLIDGAQIPALHAFAPLHIRSQQCGGIGFHAGERRPQLVRHRRHQLRAKRIQFAQRFHLSRLGEQASVLDSDGGMAGKPKQDRDVLFLELVGARTADVEDSDDPAARLKRRGDGRANPVGPHGFPCGIAESRIGHVV